MQRSAHSPAPPGEVMALILSLVVHWWNAADPLCALGSRPCCRWVCSGCMCPVSRTFRVFSVDACPRCHAPLPSWKRLKEVSRKYQRSLKEASVLCVTTNTTDSLKPLISSLTLEMLSLSIASLRHHGQARLERAEARVAIADDAGAAAAAAEAYEAYNVLGGGGRRGPIIRWFDPGECRLESEPSMLTQMRVS